MLNPDTNNDASTHVDIDVALTDAFNDKSMSDSHNDSSQKFGEIDVNFENVFNGAFGGGGGNVAFAVSQVADIVDHDNLQNFGQDNSGNFNTQAFAQTADVSGSWDGVGGGNSTGGHNGTEITAIADGRASSGGSAFNMEVVMGANLQQNDFDATVVGGSMDDNSSSGDSI